MSTTQARLSRQTYRPDIDGLRAVAILSVILFHAFPRKLKGGFMGVDVFFVISGYLISTIIFSNLERGTFSFSEFYARRIRRIFPALLLILLSSFAFGWFALLGDEFEQLGKHILAGTGFVSNLVLWNESGYFDNAAESKPLLHLWSLGIEEQFYIMWPLLVWLTWKRRAGLLPVTVIVLLVSFLLNVYAVRADTIAAFYSPLTRLWELSVGSLLAYLVLHKHIDSSRFSPLGCNLISVVGFTVLASAMVLTTKRDAFPGWRALLPVVGVALVIMAGTRSWLNGTVLSNRIAVWFGLISFPLYLWHWPILSFARIVQRQTPDESFSAIAVSVSILLAWLTYRFVERHVRSGKGYKSVGTLLCMNLCVGGAGAYVLLENGVMNRKAVTESGLNQDVRSQFVGPYWAYAKNDICLDKYPFKNADKLAWWFCMSSDERAPTLVILGNSYANQLYPGFAENPLLSHHTVVSIGTCDFAGVEENLEAYNPCYGRGIQEQADFIDDLVSKEKSIRFAIIGGLSREPNVEYIEKLRRRIDLLERHGITVIVFTPHLEAGFHPKLCFTTPLRKVARDCSFSVDDRTALLEKFRPLIESISRSNPKVRFFEQNDIFCGAGRCSFILNGMPLHRDEWHISEYASAQLQRYFSEWARKNLPEILDAGYVRQ